MNKGQTSNPSFSVISTRSTGPLHQLAIVMITEFHEAKERRDQTRLAELQRSIPETISQCLAQEAHNHVFPLWFHKALPAGWLVAQGKYDEALLMEKEGWLVLRTPRAESQIVLTCMAISASNIAEVLIHLHRGEEAIPWAELSQSLQPERTDRQVTTGLAYHSAGHVDIGDTILLPLVERADFKDRFDKVALNLKYERRVQTLPNSKAAALLRTKLTDHSTSQGEF